MLKAFRYGDVIITIGTGKLSDREQEAFGLAGEHAYAVLDVNEAGDRRRLLVKNPWVDGKSWTKPARALAQEARGSEATEDEMPGTFWMDLNDVLQYFETMHLSWNPGLFRFKKDCHFSWDLRKRSGPGSLLRNPQYSISSEKGGTVWVLLNKHFQGRDAEEKDPHSNTRPPWPVDFISLYLFESAHRVALTDGSSSRTAYVDSNHVLLHFDLLPRKRYVIVVSEQAMRASEAKFTLSAFSLDPLTIFGPAPDENPYVVQATGSWTLGTAGGNVNSLEYHTNPQFAFTLPRDSLVTVTLETTDEKLPVHVKFLWLKGRRITAQPTARDVLGDSGEYRRGSAAARIPVVLAGTHTIVASTFHEGQLGKFTLHVRAAVDGCALAPIPPADAGRLVTRLAPAVFGPGPSMNRLLAPVEVVRVTRLCVRARSRPGPGQSACSSAIRIMLEHGQGPNKRAFAASASGNFGDARRGVVTPDVDLSPAACARNGPGVWLVAERAGEDTRRQEPEEVSVEVLSSERGVAVGPWGRESDVPIEELRREMAAKAVFP